MKPPKISRAARKPWQCQGCGIICSGPITQRFPHNPNSCSFCSKCDKEWFPEGEATTEDHLNPSPE